MRASAASEPRLTQTGQNCAVAIGSPSHAQAMLDDAVNALLGVVAVPDLLARGAAAALTRSGGWLLGCKLRD